MIKALGSTDVNSVVETGRSGVTRNKKSTLDNYSVLPSPQTLGGKQIKASLDVHELSSPYKPSAYLNINVFQENNERKTPMLHNCVCFLMPRSLFQVQIFE